MPYFWKNVATMYTFDFSLQYRRSAASREAGKVFFPLRLDKRNQYGKSSGRTGASSPWRRAAIAIFSARQTVCDVVFTLPTLSVVFH